MIRITFVALMSLTITLFFAGCTNDNVIANNDLEMDASLDAMMGDGAGGGGGEGGMGGGGEGGMGGSMVNPDDCVSICGTVAECFEMECMDLEAAEIMDISVDCIDACSESRGFRTVAAGIEECGELVDFVSPRLSNPEWGACNYDPGNPEQNAGCAVFAARYTECLMERCEGGREIAELFEASSQFFCDSGVERGDFSPQDLANFANPDVPCDSTQLSRAITDRLVVDPQREGTGDLAQFCAEGPIRDQEVCLAACENFGRCIPPDSDAAWIRNTSQCTIVCATNEEFFRGADLECIATTEQCGAMENCFTTPEFEECIGFSTVVTECMQEECESIELVSDTLQGYINGFCNGQRAAGELNDAIIASAVENRCEDETTSDWVRYFVSGFPGDPNSGSLRDFCEDGPFADEELCNRASAKLGDCQFSEEDPNEADYRYICLTTDNDIPDGAWECVDEGEDCVSHGACFR